MMIQRIIFSRLLFLSTKCRRDQSTKDWPVTMHTHPIVLRAHEKYPSEVGPKNLMQNPMQDKAMPSVAIKKDQKYNPAYLLNVPQIIQSSSMTLYSANDKKTMITVKSVWLNPSSPAPKERVRIRNVIIKQQAERCLSEI